MSTRFWRILLMLLALPCVGSAVAADEAPRRVVSLNVCTDQLAMLVAAEGQLYSVSKLAAEPRTSALAELVKDKGYVLNSGQTEEIFLMQPDLVLAGSFSTRATVDLLRRLGFRVEMFEPETSLEDIRRNLLRMGDLLGREERAAELLRDFDSGVKALRRNAPDDKTVALYEVNSHTSGKGTLADAVVEAAGLINLASKLGYTGSVRLPLELLIMAEPELIAGGDIRYEAPALAEQNFVHPAYRALLRQGKPVDLPSGHMVCGGPFTLLGARLLQEAAR